MIPPLLLSRLPAVPYLSPPIVFAKLAELGGRVVEYPVSEGRAGKTFQRRATRRVFAGAERIAAMPHNCLIQ
jgi:hypothetical protein